MSRKEGGDGKTRIYYSTHIRNIQYPVTVLTELGFFEKGATNIPHKIAEAVSTAVSILDAALDRITLEKYSDRNDDVAKVHYMVFRDDDLRRACKAVQNQNTEKEAAQQARKVLADKFMQRDPRSNSIAVGEVTYIIDELNKIRAGLTTPPLVIKVNNKRRKHSDHAPNVSGEELPNYFRGLVKQREELIKGKRVDIRGNIEIGYESFRTALYIPRIILHEGAHKYCKSEDGKDGFAGYWKSNYSDYIDSNMGIFKRDNADSLAVFAWALAQNDIGVKVPGLFNSTTLSKWNS